MYFVLFKTMDDTINSTGTLGSHISYIIEKFDMFFDSPPNINDKEIWNRGTNYMVKWGLDLNEFINSKEYPKWLFTHYLVHSIQESIEIRKEYKDISIEEHRFRRLIMIYNKFFSSYDPISEESLEHLLHSKLKEFYNEVVEEHKMIFRNVYINQLTNQ